MTHTWTYGGRDSDGRRHRSCEHCGMREHWTRPEDTCPPDLGWLRVTPAEQQADRDARRLREAAE